MGTFFSSLTPHSRTAERKKNMMNLYLILLTTPQEDCSTVKFLAHAPGLFKVKRMLKSLVRERDLGGDYVPRVTLERDCKIALLDEDLEEVGRVATEEALENGRFGTVSLGGSCASFVRVTGLAGFADLASGGSG
ncbi:MAG: hypothetical protein ACPG77_02815, partial [Nannocystaceae bacterium]